jgi:hypothetical protein
MSWWYLSFADEKGFRGAVIVKALEYSGIPVFNGVPVGHVALVPGDQGNAVMAAHRLKINPGGEAMGVEIDDATAALITDKWKNRLLSREDIAAFDTFMEKAQS